MRLRINLESDNTMGVLMLEFVYNGESRSQFSWTIDWLNVPQRPQGISGKFGGGPGKGRWFLPSFRVGLKQFLGLAAACLKLLLNLL